MSRARSAGSKVGINVCRSRRGVLGGSSTERGWRGARLFFMRVGLAPPASAVQSRCGWRAHLQTLSTQVFPSEQSDDFKHCAFASASLRHTPSFAQKPMRPSMVWQYWSVVQVYLQ